MLNKTYNRYLEGAFRRLRKVGIDLHPCLLVREAIEADLPHVDIDPRFEFSELGEDDLPGIHNLRPGMSLDRYRRLLTAGKLCFGLKDQGRLVAKMWIDLDEINSVLYSRPLAADEAYLFDAFSDEAYRGQNLAPFLRVKCYERIRSLGRTHIYSISDYTNTPARRFKQKLGSRDAVLILYWKVFGGSEHRWILKRYATTDRGQDGRD